jgi:hypothetical protein
MAGEPINHPRFGALVRSGSSSKLVGTLLAGAGGAVLLVIGLVVFTAGPFALVVTAPFWILALFLIHAGLKYRSQTLAVYEGGFVRLDWRSRVEAAWSEIEGLRRTSYKREGAVLFDNCWIEVRGRKPLVAVDLALSDFGQVGAALDARSAAGLTPRYEQALQRGEAVSFGPIIMNADGLLLKGRSVAWDEILEIWFRRSDRGWLSTASRYEAAPSVVFRLQPRSAPGDEVSFSEKEILNPAILADLAQRVGRVAVA